MFVAGDLPLFVHGLADQLVRGLAALCARRSCAAARDGKSDNNNAPAKSTIHDPESHRKDELLTLGHPYRGPMAPTLSPDTPSHNKSAGQNVIRQTTAMLRITAINKVKFAPHNALRARKKTEVPIIVCRHVASNATDQFDIVAFSQRLARPHNRYNRHNQPTLTTEPPSVRTPDRSRTCTACGLAR